MKSHVRELVGDFETTVFDGQEFTEVWASAVVEIGTEDVVIHNSINETFAYLCEIAKYSDIMIYYHNLKFDGSFWLYFLLNTLKFKQAINNNVWVKDYRMINNSFKYTISATGQWYTIKIKVHSHIIEIRDSLKLLPFTVKEIGKAFNTKHQKTDIEYTGYRYAGCVITDVEKEYIKNDVLVVKEALEKTFANGHRKLTIGACCLDEYKKSLKNNKQSSLCVTSDFRDIFPNLSKKTLPNGQNVDEFIRKSYRGGWCYLKDGCENKIYKKGITLDVNSLYPSVMHSDSGNIYPIGEGNYWKGDIPNIALRSDIYYFIHFTCQFEIKPNFLPFVQIKGNFLYNGNESLTTSNVYNKKDGKYYEYYIDPKDGKEKKAIVELTMTRTDYKLFKEHYFVYNETVIDGMWFHTELGLFDYYIDKYKDIKITSTDKVQRTIAKLYLNNLYGKTATSTDSSFKTVYINEKGALAYTTISDYSKEPVYIPVGSAITSYARDFTIRHAQKNYKSFIYADTDSCHLNTSLDKVVGFKLHDTDFNCWKCESFWDSGIFVRQKTYIEHVTHVDCEPIEEPYYNIVCAGMGKRCKELLKNSLLYGDGKEELKKEYKNDDEKKFLEKKRTLKDFKKGLVIPSSLKAKNIKGGVLLVSQNYEMR